MGTSDGVSKSPKRDSSTSLMDSKLIMGLGPLTDDKSAFRHWDLKLTNALNCVKRGYGDALDWLKEAIDRGEDPEDARPGASWEAGSARSGTVLIENLRDVKVSEVVRHGDAAQTGVKDSTASPNSPARIQT